MSVFGEVELGVSRAVFDEEDDEVMPKELALFVLFLQK